MFHCELCGQSCDTKLAFVRHMKLHKNLQNLTFKCALPDCKRIFRKVSVFKTHVYRDHRAKCQRALDESSFSSQCTNDTPSCHVDFCTERCDFVTEKCQSVHLVDQGVYCLTESTCCVCTEHKRLLDYYPLPEYNMLGLSVILLHHSFPFL